MAQYYQIIGQDQSIQTVTIEELRQYYPNLTCIESSTGVQYVLNSTDDNGAQFQSQQVLLTGEQQIVLNSGEASQQIIVDQSQIAYQQPAQQYTVQENDMVADYQQNEINTTQQVYYTTTNEVKQQLIHTPQTQIINQQINQRQITSQQIINASPRIVTQHVSPSPIRQMVPQQINNAHLLQQRRVSVGSNQQQPVTTPNAQRLVQTNTETRIQFTPSVAQEQIQESPNQNQQQVAVEQDDNQFILNEGRLMTLGQLKHELQNQQENINVHQSVITNQSVQTCVEKQYKQPAPKRNNNRRTVNNNTRGGKGKNRGGQNSRMLPDQPQNHATSPKPFQQLTNTQKSVVQYQNKMQQTNQLKQPQLIAHQQRPVQQMQQQTLIQQPQVQQQQHRPLQHNVQPQQQQQQQFQHSPNGQTQPLIPLLPQVHNGHLIQNSTYSSPPSNQLQHQQYLDDSNSSLSDEYKDSARMLVCLENGEQRLITFTLPKESCTVQDLLEQVGVPFNGDTNIECIANPGNDIDYIVNVGCVNTTQSTIDAQQVLTVDSLNESQECIVSQSGAVIPLTEPLPDVPPKPKSPEKPPELPRELPKFVPGFLAVCNHCGYLSEDFNRCQRCKTKLKEDVKKVTTSLDANQADDKKSETGKLIKPVTCSPLKPILKNSTNNVKPAAKTPRGRKPKAQDLEPVVLTLSSDDEDSPPKSPINHSSQMVNRIIDNAVTLSAISKEPVISENCNPEIEEDDILQCILSGGKDDETRRTSTTFVCRTVRIGSYRFVPKGEVVINSNGLTMCVPLIGDPNQTYTCIVPTKYMIKVLGNFSKQLPVLFFYVSPSMGSIIRKNLNMEQGSDFYFDPISKEDPYKRITLLPEIISEDTKVVIKEIYLSTTYKMLEELTAKEANDILIRTCPKDPPINKSSVHSNCSFTEIRQLLIYPPGKGGIPINAEDYLCLAQDQFLNDVIIDFYLKYLWTDVLAPQMQEKVYIFSSFFYKRLTTKPAKATKRSNPFEVDQTLTAAEKRHCRVKNWTKNVNVFEKDYIIIPINENSHWFLAIICYPGLEGCRSMFDTNKIIKVPTKEKKKVNSITIGNTTITIKTDDKSLHNTVEKTIKCDEEDISDRDEAEGDESELEESDGESDHSDITTTSDRKNQREPIKQPCILIFDSLAGASRSRVVATLRDYLTCEHKAKINVSKSFTKENIKGACPKVPQQMNFTDCGLYVLQYVESFFKDPITDYHIPIKMLKNWFEEIVVTRKREEISSLIKELMYENKKDSSILPDIAFPTCNGELISNMADEEEMEQGEMMQDTSMQESDKADSSLVSDMYNSDSSNESPTKQTDFTDNSTVMALTTVTATESFIVTNVDNVPKPDLSELPKKSNRDTMSYLKSKRIQRHKNNESNEVKKQKMDE